jgi:arabinose-5-phosphate isomerase
VNDNRILELARDVLRIEAEAVLALAERIDERHFVAACRMCLECRGRLIITGMGKSGHIARKAAATLTSTGSPAVFMHPAEALHGDLGVVTRDDLVVAMSNSGETEEVITLLPLLKRLGVPMIAMTGRPDSTIASHADIVLDVSVAEEACPLNLAPTASTTASLAMSDALALALLEARGFTAEDFARSHPAGTLGRRLLLQVRDIMHTGAEIPTVAGGSSLGTALVEMSAKGLGMTAIADPDGRVTGIFTDGDLRRALDRRLDPHSTPIDEVMTPSPKTVRAETLASEAVHLMDKHRITGLLVDDDQGRLIGALNIHDLMRAGVV